MRHPGCLSIILASFAAATPAAADDTAHNFSEKLVMDDGRFASPAADPNGMSFSIPGEFQLRYRANNDLPLQPSLTNNSIDYSTLGRNHHLVQWLRLKPIFQYRTTLQLVAEIDLPYGIVVGDVTQGVEAARDSGAELRWYDVRPRQLYVQYLTPIGLFRIGQQSSHWGMGLLANDGNHASLFGDYRRGNLVERLLFATKPLGVKNPLQLILAGDLVFEDARARLLEGDRAVQAVGALRWQAEHYELGVYGVMRHQERQSESVDAFTTFNEQLDVTVVDVAGKAHGPVPGTDAHFFGEMEAVFIAGKTDYLRNIDQSRTGSKEELHSFAAAARLGVVHQAESEEPWGDLVVALEWGYATGDADPHDGKSRRFTMSQNHNVGLVLFDHVLAWKTARAATNAQDDELVNRAAPGLQFLPSEGGIFGATYLNPTMVIRPKRWLDLKLGAVFAQTTADVVDPYHYGVIGELRNFDGGAPEKHALGAELDLGLDARIDLDRSIRLQLGAEGGVLFPGNAFDNEIGERLPVQIVVNTKLGMQF